MAAIAKVPPFRHRQPKFHLYCASKGLKTGQAWRTWEYLEWSNKHPNLILRSEQQKCCFCSICSTVRLDLMAP